MGGQLFVLERIEKVVQAWSGNVWHQPIAGLVAPPSHQ